MKTAKGKYKEICHHCGASMMKNKYTMNMVLIRAMAKILRDPHKHINSIGLTKSEYANISKLKHWGLAIKLEDGRWEITPLGREFLNGGYDIPREISYFRNKLIEVSDEKVSVFDILPTDESKQKYREMMEPILRGNT